MDTDCTQRWLDALGYTAHGDAVHGVHDSVPAKHAYASELRALLDPSGLIQATAVFDVQGVPTVCFLDPSGRPDGWIETVRQRIWNQNLVSILLIVEDTRLTACSPLKSADAVEALTLSEASPSAKLAPSDVQSGDVWSRQPTWFNAGDRIDNDLLDNLSGVIKRLITEQNLDRSTAQLLLGQTLFVSYLEHRGIVSPYYRKQHAVGELHALIRARDRKGLVRLLSELSDSFNGDFLAPAVATRAGWSRLADGALGLLDDFLARVDMRTGQGSFWNYDFRFIPVELLSGIYETFLSDEQRELGAYYTPRHLANLVVDLAFDGIADPAAEVVYDGACGSGILLTTAFRRMLSHIQALRGEVLPLSERIDLLTHRILGSDISEPACRVTAFSLYLSLLEDLVPADIAKLTEDPGTKLPPLLGHTIHHGKQNGDFFSLQNSLAKRTWTIALSNPPWREPDGNETGLSFETWLKEARRVTVRRQIAGAYAQRAVALAPPEGRVVLILPISLLLASTSQPFVRDWLLYARTDCIINFGDLRRQLFPKAKHGCAVIVARPRPSDQIGQIPPEEQFDYWAPKVDVGLAFGRLSLHTGDRHRVHTQHWWEDNFALRTLTWGGREDQRLIGRLKREGSLIGCAEAHGWELVKGFNRTRRGSKKLDPAPLAKFRYLDARKIPTDAPTLSPSLLEKFPKEITSVVSYGSKNGRAFHGPRVLFPDGISDGLQLRTVFTNRKATFKHTVAAICGSSKDEDVLRFLAVYLRSGLARYLALHTSFSPANERERITVEEVEQFPFVHPDDHPNPRCAWTIVRRVGGAMRKFEERDGFMTAPWEDADYEDAVNEYFGLSEVERALVHETVQWALPSRQMADPARLQTPWQDPPTKVTVQGYTRLLKQSLQRWRDARGGSGQFEITAHLGMRASRRGVGIVEIRVTSDAPRGSTEVSAIGLEGVHALLTELARKDLLPMRVTENLYLSADFLVVSDNSAYLIKPLANRLWRPSQASRDARRLVEHSTGGSAQ